MLRVVALAAAMLATLSLAAAQEITVKYTQKEAETAATLYDWAVRAEGMKAAGAALMLTQKLQAAAAEAQKQANSKAKDAQADAVAK